MRARSESAESHMAVANIGEEWHDREGSPSTRDYWGLYAYR